MASELTLEPISGQLPEAVAFSPELSAAPALKSIGVIPTEVAEKVTVGARPSWVVERELEADATATGPSNRWLLIDRQCHAESREYYTRTVRKLDTINALQEAGQWTADFDPRDQRLTVHSLAVIRGEQRAENARPERLRILQREAGLEHLTISGLLTVVLVLEDLRVGDVVDVSYTLESRSPIFPDHFWSWTKIPGNRPVQAFHACVRFATGRAMQWKSNDPKLTPTIREEQGETEWWWQTTVASGTDAEVNVPSWHVTGKWIQVSDFASWAEVASGLAAAWKEDLENPEVIRVAEAVAAEGGTPAELAERALTILQDGVRYLSVDGDLGGAVPSAPGVVLQRGYGDCKDKAFAAAHVLRRLGIPARPTVVNTRFCQAVREFLPMPSVFDHAIVELELEERRRWLDVTATHQGGTALSRPGAQFQLGLAIGPGVRDLEPIASDSAGDRFEVRETFLIDTSGRHSSLRVVVTTTGREAERWRRSVAEEGVEVFAQRREQFYQRVFPNAVRMGKLELQDDRERNEFAIGEMYDLHEAESLAYGRRGVQCRLVAHTIQSVLSLQQAGKRRHPWALPFPLRIKHVIELESPGLRAPQARTDRVDCAAFCFAANWQGQPGITVITFTLEMLENAVPVGEFDSFKEKVREVWSRIGVHANLPPGSSVSWKKRSPENVLPPRRKPSVVQPRTPQEERTRRVSLPEIAPACAPRESTAADASTPANGRKGVLVPRRERDVALHEARPAGRREPIRRPNPIVPSKDQPVDESRSRSSRSARRRRRQRRRMVLWAGICAGSVGFIMMLLFLLRLK